eukprot:COSAG06_NODE_2529_length_6714_cov_2.777627_2_plen_91_part_00
MRTTVLLNPYFIPIPLICGYVGANMIQEVLDRSNPAYAESQLPKRQRFVYKGMVGRGLYVLMMQVRKRSFSKAIYVYRNDHFTKTGSGQT